MDKTKLRITATEKRRLIPTDEKRTKSQIILKKLESLHEFKTAKKILAYYSHDSEVAIVENFERWMKTKKLYLPRLIDGETFEIAPYGELRPNRFGIPEPIDGSAMDDPDLILIPGLAFDRRGTRLGMGKGYYDRFLSKKKGILRVGLAFSEQILASLPKEPYDENVDLIITDSEIIKTIK